MVKCIIVDDEENSRENLENLIGRFCEGLEIVGKADSVEEALLVIEATNPEAIFLDIHMPDADGFTLLEKLNDYSPMIVFVTAHEHYALKAIKASAVDYLLKPVSIRELQAAAEKLEELKKLKNTDAKQYANYQDSLQLLSTSLKLDQSPQRIALPSHNGFLLEDVNNIVRLESDNNYTVVHLDKGAKIMVSKPLKHFEDCLDEKRFLRIHNSHIVNFDFIKAYHREDGGSVELRDGTNLQISKRKLTQFLDLMKGKFLKV